MAINRVITLVGLVSLISISFCYHANSLSQKKPIGKSHPSIPHQSNLSPLQLGSGKDVLNLLDLLYQKGGTQAVARWVEQELQPGRKIIFKESIQENKIEKKILYDRSIWRLDEQGHITNKAILPPLTDEKYGDSEFFISWSRSTHKEPFVLRLRVWIK